MRFILSLVLALVLFQACFQNSDNNKNVFAFLKDCNEIEILFDSPEDKLSFQTTDSLEISILTELISGRQDAISNVCKPQGKIIYKANGHPIFKAEFSTSGFNKEVDCNFVVYDLNGKMYMQRLTYRSGRLLEDILWDK